MLDQDQVLLSTVNSNVTEKKAVLETQEGKVRQLQQQLESARKLVLRSRLLVNKLNEQVRGQHLAVDPFQARSTIHLNHKILR